MNELISVREAALRLFLGARAGDILNEAPYNGAALPGPELAGALKQAVNAFQSTAFLEDGQRVDYSQLRQSQAYADYRSRLTPQLRRLDLATLSDRREQLAFWINLYNALVIDAVLAYEVQRSVTERMAGLAFFGAAAYNIGGQRYSLQDIEHGILRNNRGTPFIPGATFKSNDPRLAYVVKPPDRRIHFALNCASRSCPPIAVYTADSIDEQLTLATRSFVNADIIVDEARNEVQLSRIFSWYADDFGGPAGVVDFITRYLPDDARKAWLQAHPQPVLAHKTYDWGLNI